ncbi:uncharacterized protein [Triticum aestivum]|uniref:uncharacterized protein n=1 Tax=Triticum aestivum TaxID=4565 RepID=UPI001D00CB5A|nr:uncharacterized protein LOC123185505 [Triticum aestivum]
MEGQDAGVEGVPVRPQADKPRAGRPNLLAPDLVCPHADRPGGSGAIQGAHLPSRSIAPDPGIELTMQALSISEPEFVHVQAENQAHEEGQDAEFNILMNLASTGGPIRVLSLQAVQQSMARAWRDNYYGISQLSRYVFVAHFRSLEAVMFVITRQPWSMGSDNFLIEWMDPEEQDKNIQDYKFDSIYVTVRIYGIPIRFRTQALLASILQKVGQISEFHPINKSMISARQEYIWGTIKAQISRPVKDKVWVSYGEDSAGWAYLFYEKIGRICTFCGIMFHSVQHCKARNSVLISRSRLQVSLEGISPNKFGQWMTAADLIPSLSEERNLCKANSFSFFVNPQLARLQKQFIEHPKGKGIAVDSADAEEANQKELSLSKINEQIRRIEEGGSSTNAELQILQNQMGGMATRCSYSQGQCPGQSDAVKISAVPSTVVNMETASVPDNNAGGVQIQGLHTPVQQGAVIPNPSQISILCALPATHISDTGPSSAIQATKEDYNPCGKAPANPSIFPGVVPSSTPPLLTVPSPIRSSPKRLPESLFGLPVPPAKKASIHGGRGRAEDQSDSVLGAPPVRQVLSPQPSATSGMGAFTVPASTGRGRTLDGSSPFGSATSQGGYHRYRYSRWDIPPARGYGGLCSNMHGVMRNRACSSTWKRDSGKGLHVDMGKHSPRIQTAMKKQDDFSSSGQGNTLDLRNDQVGENMELNVGMDTRVAESFPRAAAHGPNAPRAP